MLFGFSCCSRKNSVRSRAAEAEGMRTHLWWSHRVLSHALAPSWGPLPDSVTVGAERCKLGHFISFGLAEHSSYSCNALLQETIRRASAVRGRTSCISLHLLGCSLVIPCINTVSLAMQRDESASARALVLTYDIFGAISLVSHPDTSWLSWASMPSSGLIPVVLAVIC